MEYVLLHPVTCFDLSGMYAGVECVCIQVEGMVLLGKEHVMVRVQVLLSCLIWLNYMLSKCIITTLHIMCML